MDVVFFPRNDYPNNIEICPHRLGKKITIADTTTMMPYYVCEILLPYIVELNRTHHIRVGGFFDNLHNLDPSYSTASYLGPYVMEQIANGVVWPDLYFMPDPAGDYSDEAQERSKQTLWNWFENKFGKIPTTILFSLQPSYYGNYMMQYILAGDRTNIPDGDTDYGIGVGNPNNVPYSKAHYYNRPCNKRALENSLENEDYATNIADLADFIDETMALPNGGFIFNFNHWHRLLYKDIDPYTGEVKEGREGMPAVNNGFKPYFNMLAQKNVNDEIYFAGYGEAIAYLVYRESISKAVMYSPIGSENDKLIIRLEAKNVFNVDTRQLQVPVSVKFSTDNTPLSGANIKSNCNMVSLGSNNYIVEIPWNEYPEAIIELNNNN